MDARQLIITTVAASFMVFAQMTAAECEDDEVHQVKTGYLLLSSNDRHDGHGNHDGQGNDDDQGDQGRDKKDKNRSNDRRTWYNPWGWQYGSKDNDSHGGQNSNRQSDPGSTRGQARAEERRGEKDKDRSNEARPWYNPWGWFE